MAFGPVTKLFGPEPRTTYSGNALNRLSFLREDCNFLESAFHSPNALFLPFLDFNALLKEGTNLQWLPLGRVKHLVGEPYSSSPAAMAKTWDPKRDASGVSHAQVVFLGVDELEPGEIAGESSHKGAPRFAVDITPYSQATPALKDALDEFRASLEEGLEFKSVIFGVNLENQKDYSIIAEARIVLDWINRTQFCAGCGSRNMSVWGGFKLLCPTSFLEKPACPTAGRITNLSFPRTDCCVIAAVVSFDGSSVLLGRGRRFRIKMYSCLAGFLESGESIEDCVRREVFEEANVKVGRVSMYASQPWPYPSNVMIGCIAEVADESPESHKIFLGNDKELLDAKWISKEELQLLCKGESSLDFVVPPKSSIAWVLLDAVSRQ